MIGCDEGFEGWSRMGGFGVTIVDAMDSMIMVVIANVDFYVVKLR